jgi:hypothetical protein
MHAVHMLAAGALVLGCGTGRAQVGPRPPGVSFGTAVASEHLAQLRGGSDTFMDTRFAGTTAANTAQHVQSGTNAISEGAFANLTGIPVVIQNTGANVLIQNALTLNVQLR